MKNHYPDTFSAEKIRAHGAIISLCLNGHKASFKPVVGEWTSPGPGHELKFYPRYAYRAHSAVTHEVVWTSLATSLATDFPPLLRTVPDSFPQESVRRYGAVIQHYLRGGLIRWRSPGLSDWQYPDRKSRIFFIASNDYEIIEDRKGPHPVEKCNCEMCESVKRPLDLTKITLPIPPGWTLEDKPVKPPLGADPEFIWIEKRVSELRKAIIRQLNREEEPDWSLVEAWITETLKHKAWLKEYFWKGKNETNQ
jgi:hypothetical protein